MLDANELNGEFTVTISGLDAAGSGAVNSRKTATLSSGRKSLPPESILPLQPQPRRGFNLIISGIRANASMVGDGEDIMANVMVGGTVVNSAPIKVADVTEGLVVKADVAAGLQCADTDAAMAVITIQEGFVDAIVSMVDDTGTTDVDAASGRIATAWW